MAFERRVSHLLRYGAVGGVAALIHALLLLTATRLGLPTPGSNLLGFLLASLWGYLAHALFTFRAHTGGGLFPRRWLLLQMAANVVLSLLLPLALGSLALRAPGLLVLVFTPTAVNYVIWLLAARHSLSRRLSAAAALEPVRFHADDLGLNQAVNRAIFALADAGALHSCSVLVTAAAVQDAAEGCRQRPALQLALHLSLSEGLPAAEPAAIQDLLDARGHLQLGFGRLLLLGLLPRWNGTRRRMERQVASELRAQITRFQALFPERPLRLDGHQHIHLAPLVWDVLHTLPPALQPSWVRTLGEPFIWRGIPLRCWWHSCCSAGPLKWALLQLLNRGRSAELRQRGIATNPGFSGVLFTGVMAAPVLAAAQAALRQRGGLVLAHPSDWPVGATPGADAEALRAFPLSARFYRSPWRQWEAAALMQRTR